MGLYLYFVENGQKKVFFAIFSYIQIQHHLFSENLKWGSDQGLPFCNSGCPSVHGSSSAHRQDGPYV
jgi:hypothetical protein